MPESLGRYIRRERQMRDVSLEQISRETKIKLSVLEALEDDRFEALPAPAIVKGFLRSYAEIVGLSGHSLVLRYESVLEERGESSKGLLSTRQRPPRKPRRLAPVLWLLLAVLALGVGVRLFDRDDARGPGDSLGPDTEETDSIVYRKNYLRELTGEARPSTPAQVAAASLGEHGPPSGGIHLLLRATAPVSIRVVLDRGEFETIALAPGQEIARHALRVTMIETQQPRRVQIQANGRLVSAGLAGGGPARFILTAGRPVPGEERGGVLPPVDAQVVFLHPEGTSFPAVPDLSFRK